MGRGPADTWCTYCGLHSTASSSSSSSLSSEEDDDKEVSQSVFTPEEMRKIDAITAPEGTNFDSLVDNPSKLLSGAGANLESPQEIAHKVQKIIPRGDMYSQASDQDVSAVMAAEHHESGGVHFMDRTYSKTLGQMVNDWRTPEYRAALEANKPYERQDQLACQGVKPGGPAYPIFYDPTKGVKRPQAYIPQDNNIQGRKSRVYHILSLYKVTGMDHSEVAQTYDECQGKYSKALQVLRKKQCVMLSVETDTDLTTCEDALDDALGDYPKALRKLWKKKGKTMKSV